MIEVQITEEMVEIAKQKSREMGKLRNSILKGEGNVSGFIGEQIALQVLGGEWANREGCSYQYDMILPDGRTVDVKTKQRGVAPRPHYNCSVSNFNPDQKCDLYGFVSVLKNREGEYLKGWFLGTIPKQEFMDRATFATQGTHDPSNNFNTPASCYNLTIEELQNVQGHDNGVLHQRA